jgi:DNA mismatch repair protein MutL
MKIIQLPEFIVSKISAGEVIERPAYAVKELIENAIDAGADMIEIHIQEGGLKKILVQDNGEGMTRDDVEIAFLPHTTSKLKDEHELIGIKTLGFRGEALSSIAATATLTIRTRTQSEPGGTEIIVRNGKIENIAPIGTPPGTIVTVDNLFLNVPARKKFLKSVKTEFRLISDIITQFSLSYPSVHFVLTHNNKTILDLSRKQVLSDRVKKLLGQSTFDELLSFNFEDGYFKVSGFVGKPQIASKQNQKQFLFVNNRHVSDRMISLSVREAFGTLLPSSSTPLFILFVTLPPEIVDVNVHPRKEQVVFVNSKQVFDGVKQAITQVLNENNLTFNLAKFKYESSAQIGETTSYSGRYLKESVLPWSRDEAINFKPTNKLLQIHQTYILLQTKNELCLIDQHAAHERILFEEFKYTFENNKKLKIHYELSKPLPLSLSLKEAQLIEEYLSYFEDIGFAIEHFQGNNFLIRNVPTIFRGRNIEKIIRDMLSDFEMGTLNSVDARTLRMLAFLSCRAAVKKGDILTDKQMKDILKKLDTTLNNTTCPHGRPTKIQISISELDKLFKR